MKRPSWQQEGEEPDYRFSLANERTFLAWIRTALAIIASSLLLHQFAPHARSPILITASSFGLALCGMVLAGSAYRRWKASEIAMRHRQPLPAGITLLVIAVAVIVLGLWVGVWLPWVGN